MAVAGKIDLVAVEKYTNAFGRIIQGYSNPISMEIQPDDLPVIQQYEEKKFLVNQLCRAMLKIGYPSALEGRKI